MNDDFLVLNGLTHHFDRLGQNEENIGVGYERRGENSSLGGGVLKDSFGNWSPYVAGGLHMDPIGPLSLGVTGTLSHRQKAKDNVNDGLTFAPMVTGEIMITDKDGLNLGIIPPISGRTGGLAMLQYKRMLGEPDKKRSSAGDELAARVKQKKEPKLGDIAGALKEREDE